MEYGGSTPFSTGSVQDLPGKPAHCFALTTKTGTRAVENGVEPPYSITIHFELENQPAIL